MDEETGIYGVDELLESLHAIRGKLRAAEALISALQEPKRVPINIEKATAEVIAELIRESAELYAQVRERVRRES